MIVLRWPASKWRQGCHKKLSRDKPGITPIRFMPGAQGPNR